MLGVIIFIRGAISDFLMQEKCVRRNFSQFLHHHRVLDIFSLIFFLYIYGFKIITDDKMINKICKQNGIYYYEIRFIILLLCIRSLEIETYTCILLFIMWKKQKIMENLQKIALSI